MAVTIPVELTIAAAVRSVLLFRRFCIVPENAVGMTTASEVPFATAGDT